jgi:DNA-binding IclR family transcriptional regulator
VPSSLKQPPSPALPAQPNQSLLDGLAILQALAASEEPVGGRELARQLGWNPMRINRLLKTLAFAGMARQTPDRRYVAGPAMHVLSVQALVSGGLLRRSIAPVEQLPRQKHSVALGVLWQDRVCYLFHAGPGQSLSSALGAHDLYPATQSSIGMVLLAQLRDEAVAALFATRPTPGYDGINALHRRLAEIRKLGYAFIEQGPRQASVAVAIGEPAYAGLALANVTEKQVPGLVAQLREAAAVIG